MITTFYIIIHKIHSLILYLLYYQAKRELIFQNIYLNKNISIRLLTYPVKNLHGQVMYIIHVGTLLNELQKFNPELLDKQRIVAISKCDLLDLDLMKDISLEMKEIPHVFFSSISGTGIVKLKDMIWKLLNS